MILERYEIRIINPLRYRFNTYMHINEPIYAIISDQFIFQKNSMMIRILMLVGFRFIIQIVPKRYVRVEAGH